MAVAVALVEVLAVVVEVVVVVVFGVVGRLGAVSAGGIVLGAPAVAGRGCVPVEGRGGLAGRGGCVGGLGEASAQELLGGREPVVGLEAIEATLHDVDEESDGGSAVVGLFSYKLREFSVHPVDSVERRWNVAGVVGLGAIASGGAGGVGDVVSGLLEAEGDELSAGVESVAGLGALEAPLHGVDEESDDEPAVVGLLVHYAGKVFCMFGWVLHFLYGWACQGALMFL